MRWEPRADALLLRRTVRLLASAPRPRSRTAIHVDGPDPLRVLVVGAGLAAGYGVRTHREALSGRIADALHAATGRGVVVQPRTVALLPARRLLSLLGPTGARAHSVVVVAGCYVEAPLVPARTFSRHVAAVVEHLQATGAPGVRIVVLGLPVPEVVTRSDAIVAERLAATNHWTRDAVEQHPSARFVPVPAPGPASQVFTPEYTVAVAAATVEDGLHDLLPAPAPRDAFC